MGLIRCLAIFSTVGVVIDTVLATQLVSSGNNTYLGVVIALSVVCCISLSLLLYKLIQARRRLLWDALDAEKGQATHGMDVEDEDEILKALSNVPTKLNFKELEIATGGFCKLLGQGGFGSVYEGELPDGTKVAVKRLETESRLRCKEFCAEVITISGIHHVNLVSLLGFCVEGNQRLLVYEFMENGSLDRWLFPKRINGACQDQQAEKKLGTLEAFQNGKVDLVGMVEEEKENMRKGGEEKKLSSGPPPLNWMMRFRIALETARALAYLHEECRDTILHLDVKPQNILLDSKFHAKVSDFGLSRAIDREQSRLVTSMRGTPGYLAPEWLINAGVTHKSDVYSYGMVLLELVSGRRNVDHSQNSDAWYFPTLAFRRAQEMRLEEIIDPALRNAGMAKADMDQACLAIHIAFWCIQDHMAARPSMTNVVRMLEGTVPVAEPPLTGVFSFTNILTFGGGAMGRAGAPFLNQMPLQPDKLQKQPQTEQQEQQQQQRLQHQQQKGHQDLALQHPLPLLHTEEPLSISIDSSTPDSPLPPPPCR